MFDLPAGEALDDELQPHPPARASTGSQAVNAVNIAIMIHQFRFFI